MLAQYQHGRRPSCANEQMQEANTETKAVSFREACMCSKLTRLKRIMTREADSPIRKIIFRDGLNVWIQPDRKQGRPFHKWTDQALKELWEQVKTEHPAHYRTVLYLCTSTVYTWPPSVGNMCSFRQFRGHTLPPTVVHPYIRPVGILRYKIFGQ